MADVENPNPRGWRTRDVFVDLGSVSIVSRDYEIAGDWVGSATYPITHIVVVGINGPRTLRLTDAEHESLLNALEIYRSGR